MGDSVKLTLIAAGCSQGAHEGLLYVDGIGATVPGIFASASAPSQLNLANCPATTPLTYNVTYKNGSATNETGVVVDFSTPPNTTFQSITAPGLACITPLPGTAGTITCTVGNLAAGASGTFQVTVNVDCMATGTIVSGTYDIHSTQETPLLGAKVTTILGCTQDNQCITGNWCNESASKCQPTLPNGQPIPTDAPHMNPTLNGACTVQAGQLVCSSQVCDTKNNECGYENGDGPCTVANGAVVCQSAVCDPGDLLCGYVNGDGPCTVANGGTVCRSAVCDGTDLKCGYAVGDGPCTPATGGTVCRSGVCSVNGTCEPAGGCNVDADCTGGNWCSESTHTCTPKLSNGTAVPTDPPHTNPTLNGTCTAAAGTLTCASGVCDTADNKCGYANGDGPCNMANGGTVCRSGACSTNGLCVPAGGCNVDADCTGGNWCLESTHTCTPQLPNGTAVPTDPPHTNPTLNGTCTAAAGTLTCVSGVCDTTDNHCGYANGDGPCTPATGGTVSRSGYSTTSGICEPNGGCATDADCGAGNWCNETQHTCTPQLDNGTAIPTDSGHMNPTITGTCTMQVGSIVCKSGVCDTNDNKCGYANGDGPCDMTNGMTVCRSQNCTTGGVCEPTGGCTKDSDCPMGNWCNETQHMCTPQLPNGQPVPTDTAHTNPTLNGMCTTQAGTVTCKSGVCDTKDNECGYANGDGPCTMADGTTVCRSQNCATTGPNSGKCVQCISDSMCMMSEKCDPTTNTCVMCVQDSDCGGQMSGMVCDGMSHECIMGCRGTGGNGCPNDKMCTSMDKTIGQCVDITMTTSSTTSTSTTGAGGGGTGGANNGGAFIQGHGVFGCSVGVGADGSSSIAGALGLLVLAGRRRRRR
jgi:MYXO-CTERM domain-containing protein